GFIKQESEQAFHRSHVNRALIVADEIADDRKPPFPISVENSISKENSGKNAGLELPAKAYILCHRNIISRHCAFRGGRSWARFILRFGGAFNFILLKIAERWVGEERNEPFLLSAPFGIHQSRQRFHSRAPTRLTTLDDRLQKRAIAFSPRRIAFLRGVFVKQ